MTIQIPEATVGSVMGKRAEILKSIIAASGGIKIFIEHSNIPGTQNREVQFTGPMEHCNYAAYLVQERVNAYYGNTGGSGDLLYAAAYGVAAGNEAYAAYSDPSMTAAAGSAGAYDYSQQQQNAEWIQLLLQLYLFSIMLQLLHMILTPPLINNTTTTNNKYIK